MTLHHLDPRHGEPCGACAGEGTPYPSDPECSQVVCSTCNGTGRTGGDAEPVIETEQVGPVGFRVWFACPGHINGPFHCDYSKRVGPYPTEGDAIFAARCALAGVQIQRRAGLWSYGAHLHETRDAALIAAIDAKRD